MDLLGSFLPIGRVELLKLVPKLLGGMSIPVHVDASLEELRSGHLLVVVNTTHAVPCVAEHDLLSVERLLGTTLPGKHDELALEVSLD